MKKVTINQEKAIVMLKEKKSLSGMEVTFDSTPVEALDAFLLRKNGISVPDELIWYDDDAIDYSDIPEWTDEELRKARLIRMILTELPLEEEVKTWVRYGHRDFLQLLSNLITDFYKNVKSIPDSNPKPAPKKGKKASV